ADETHRWIVDPLDGTTNFLHGIPLCAISIGLEREGQLVAGLVYNPAMDEMFTAETGKGAFLNDRRLRGARRAVHLAAAVAYTRPRGGMFTAETGRGAFLNDRRLRVASRQTLADAL